MRHKSKPFATDKVIKLTSLLKTLSHMSYGSKKAIFTNMFLSNDIYIFLIINEKLKRYNIGLGTIRDKLKETKKTFGFIYGLIGYMLSTCILEQKGIANTSQIDKVYLHSVVDILWLKIMNNKYRGNAHFCYFKLSQILSMNVSGGLSSLK